MHPSSLLLFLPLAAARAWGRSASAATPLRASPFPSGVSRMNSTQKDAMDNVRATAYVASAGATQLLLEHLDSYEFRTHLHVCCPALETLDAAVLLEMLRDMTATAELAHNFDGSFDTDMTIEIGLYNATEYFATLWQLRNLGYYGDPLNPKFGHPSSPEDAGEEGVFSLPPFEGAHDMPLSFGAASSRLHYVALNLQRVDVGNPTFGNVTAIFSPSFLEDAVAAAPIDTGLYTMGCNETYKATPGAHSLPDVAEKLACDEGDITAGITGAMDHVLLNNQIFWSKSGIDTIGRAFARTHADPSVAPQTITNATSAELTSYIESNVLANALYAQRPLKLFVGSFTALFGSDRGKLLQEWAATVGVALTWGIGTGHTDYRSLSNATSFAGDRRFVDVPTASGLLNTSTLPEDAQRFELLWKTVAEVRSQAGGALPVDKAWQLWSQACTSLSPSLLVALPKPGDCAEWERTLGKSEAGECVGYVVKKHKSQPNVTAQRLTRPT